MERSAPARRDDQPVPRRSDVEAAARRLQGRLRTTPVLPAGELSRRVGAEVWLKAESLQLTGSFKARGAFNAILQLEPPELERGVIAASAGNHAQAVAYAARAAGTQATLLMPAGAPLAKIAAVRQYGGSVQLVDGSYDDCQEAARELAADEGRPLIHAFDQAEVVAGQGTVGLELAEQLGELDLVVVPLGGGGLIGGIALALAAPGDGPRIVGVQADACAPYPASLAASRPIGTRAERTIADGIAVKEPGELTLPLVERYVDDVVTVGEDEAAEAMVLLLERSKLVVEGAGAVGVAALMHGLVSAEKGARVAVVLSGGNVDAQLLAECIRLGETSAGRRLVLSTVVPDRPGALAGLLRILADGGANVLSVEHAREGMDLHVRETAIRLVLAVRGPDHAAELTDAVCTEGFPLADPAARFDDGGSQERGTG